MKQYLIIMKFAENKDEEEEWYKTFELNIWR